MPVLVILTRYHGDESNSKWGQGQRGGSSDRNFAPDPEYIWIYEYLTRLHLCVCVFIQIYETNKHGTKLILMRIANFDSPLWHNSFWRSRLFVIVCCCVWWLWLSIWNIAKKALLSQTLAAHYVLSSWWSEQCYNRQKLLLQNLLDILSGAMFNLVCITFRPYGPTMAILDPKIAIFGLIWP